MKTGVKPGVKNGHSDSILMPFCHQFLFLMIDCHYVIHLQLPLPPSLTFIWHFMPSPAKFSYCFKLAFSKLGCQLWLYFAIMSFNQMLLPPSLTTNFASCTQNNLASSCFKLGLFQTGRSTVSIAWRLSVMLVPLLLPSSCASAGYLKNS